MRDCPSPLTMSVLVALLAGGVVVGMAQNPDSAGWKKDPRPNNHYAEFAKVPEKARAKSNPFAEDPDAPAAGRKLFEQHCAECHGTTAEGGKKAPSLRAEEVQQASPGALFWVLTNGVVRQGMPVWSKLPEAQRWQIVTYLKSLSLQKE
jgi:mono/diheme cytochrome c family protein